VKRGDRLFHIPSCTVCVFDHLSPLGYWATWKRADGTETTHWDLAANFVPVCKLAEELYGKAEVNLS
jgi:hypothetical protein